MAHSLDLRVIAEGVENIDQFALLRALGCEEIQGYLLSPPIPAEEFTQFVKHPTHGLLAGAVS